MNKVAASMNIPANKPIKRAAPIDTKDRIKLIKMIFTIPACPPTNFTAKYSGKADKISVMITNNAFAAINAVMSIIFF